MKAHQRFRQDCRRIVLIGNHNPFMALEPSAREPSAHGAPPWNVPSAFALNPPAKPGRSATRRIVIHTEDPKVVKAAARQPDEQPIDGRLSFGKVHRQQQWGEGVGHGSVGAFGPARMVHDR